MITTEAIAWCHQLGVALVVCDSDGQVLFTGGPRLYRHGALIKAQAIASTTETGISIVRGLLDRRLADQAAITRDQLHRPDRAQAIDELRPELIKATTTADSMVIEMQAADHYWSAWRDETRLSFVARDRARIPAHWLRFDTRSSPLNEGASNRHAANPVNAMLNYGMRLAEIEVALACHAIGLDPHIGLAHADHSHRAAFVLDLVEALRGPVEETVWQLTASRTFRKSNFAETQTGEVRLLAPFSHDFAVALLPTLRERSGSAAESVAQQLLDATISTRVTVPTVLTRERSKIARSARGDRARDQRRSGTAAAQLWTCTQCGGPVENRRHVRCAHCIAGDPRQTPEIRGRRGRAIAARRARDAEWESTGRELRLQADDWPAIQAALRGVKLMDIVTATGLSKSFASTLRAGRAVPHVSHWEALAALGGVANTAN